MGAVKRRPPVRVVAALEESEPTAKRAMAKVLYAQDLRERSLVQLRAEELAFSEVSIRTLERWSAADDWPSARRKFWDSVHQVMAQRTGRALADFLRRQLDDLIGLYDVAKASLASGAVRPKSYEGLVKSLLEIAQRIDDLAERVPHNAQQDDAGRAAAARAAVEMDPDYALHLAHVMLRYEAARERGAKIDIVEVEPTSVT